MHIELRVKESGVELDITQEVVDANETTVNEIKEFILHHMPRKIITGDFFCLRLSEVTPIQEANGIKSATAAFEIGVSTEDLKVQSLIKHLSQLLLKTVNYTSSASEGVEEEGVCPLCSANNEMELSHGAVMEVSGSREIDEDNQDITAIVSEILSYVKPSAHLLGDVDLRKAIIADVDNKLKVIDDMEYDCKLIRALTYSGINALIAGQDIDTNSPLFEPTLGTLIHVLDYPDNWEHEGEFEGFDIFHESLGLLVVHNSKGCYLKENLAKPLEGFYKEYLNGRSAPLLSWESYFELSNSLKK